MIKQVPVHLTHKGQPYDIVFVSWEAHLKGHEGYVKRYGNCQTAERVAERGGFSDEELDEFYPEWRNHIIQ